MKGLDSDRAALVQATARAEKVAQLVFASATVISANKWLPNIYLLSLLQKFQNEILYVIKFIIHCLRL